MTLNTLPHWVGLVISVSASHAVGRGFAPRPGHTKDLHKNGTNCLPAWHACVRVDSAAWLCKRRGSEWYCLWGHALYRLPGINRKSRVLYPGCRFLSSATWPSMLKRLYNGLLGSGSSPVSWCDDNERDKSAWSCTSRDESKTQKDLSSSWLSHYDTGRGPEHISRYLCNLKFVEIKLSENMLWNWNL